ncbi:hypothetical protein WJX72_007586 [[Myrmecia] bisecta]|uniref:Dynein axonemal assembly factor 11-like CS domain-containing protein n=1 Tax=[Myrmecia] bisecta TaxID=41462 RepID=A0AAW1Q7N7_9CHLO
MGRITHDMLRKRAEHNEGILSTLEEVSLHQQDIQQIELLGQLCRHLKILYLQNNLISKLENLHRLKELEYLNVAVNNITKIQNLQRCESLTKLDLTVNFVDKAGLLSVASLRCNPLLCELYLLGNPCAEWQGYRPFVIATLPRLQRLDGQNIKPSERIAAIQLLPELDACLRAELRAQGVDPDQAAAAEDDSMTDLELLQETGHVGEDGELRRPWTAATRLLEHREMEAANRQAEEKRCAEQQRRHPEAHAPTPLLRTDFPELQDGERVLQKNEGRWAFTLGETGDGRALRLEVALGRYLDPSLVKADVQARCVRLLVKGRLLQLALPQEVKPDSSTAQRSSMTGHLVLTMPKEDPSLRPMDVTCMRPRAPHQKEEAGSSSRCSTCSRPLKWVTVCT